MSEQPEEALAAVYLTNATRTSRGTGPGPLRVPLAEAGMLVRNRLAVYGDRAPRGLLDGGAPPVQAGIMPRGG
jgi:hypothetical protein